MEKEAQMKQQSKNVFLFFSLLFFLINSLFSINKLLTLNPETDSPDPPS